MVPGAFGTEARKGLGFVVGFGLRASGLEVGFRVLGIT